METPRQPVDLSLILACYREEEIFEESLARIIEILDSIDFTYEVILVDDKSPDRTRELIEKALGRYKDKPIRAIFHERNLGRGAAVCTGFKAAQGEAMGFIDIDLEVAPSYILPCWLALRKADISLGKRIYKIRFGSLHRAVLSWGYHWLCSALLRLPEWDSETGYKFFRREAIQRLMERAHDPGWFWDTEVMLQARAMGLSVQEVPCLFIRRLDKTSTVRVFRDSYDYFRRLLSYRVDAPGPAGRT
ncbi:MAG: glycosyltransferase family 2 protein [Elusimicrobiota bacterium]|jgi:dolichol-phosphate mannosyltransferase